MNDHSHQIANQIQALDSHQVKALVLSWLTDTGGSLQDFESLLQAEYPLSDQPQTEAEMIEKSLQALEEYQRTGTGISHDRVREWLDSLGTDQPLPCPK
jgi:hypothetical protein